MVGLEAGKQVSAATTYGAGGATALYKTAEAIEPTWVDWINHYAGFIGVCIAALGLIANIVINIVIAIRKSKSQD